MSRTRTRARDTRESLLAMIECDPSPIHKMVFADYLEEQGENSLARAYHWAAKKDRHPRYGFEWGWKPSGDWVMGHLGQQNCQRIPFFVYRAIDGVDDQTTAAYYPNAEQAFAALATALDRIWSLLE